MQTEYDIGRFTRRCWRLDRPLEPGEAYYSALVDEQGQLTRRDFSEAGWQGPPEHCIGWWRNRLPPATSTRLRLAPHSVLIGLLQQMVVQSGQQELSYLLALLLIRRRALRVKQTDAQRPDVLLLEVPIEGSTIEIPACQIAPERHETLQRQLVDLLYSEGA
jgi:hypothetical protein